MRGRRAPKKLGNGTWLISDVGVVGRRRVVVEEAGSAVVVVVVVVGVVAVDIVAAGAVVVVAGVGVGVVFGEERLGTVDVAVVGWG